MIRTVLCTLLAAAAVSTAAQERPLPDPAAFLAETRTHLQTDQVLQSSYSYVETRRDQKLDKHGRATNESVKVYESYPGLPGEPRWERLVAEDGRPVAAEKLEEQDRDRQRKAQAYARKMERQPKRTYEEQVEAWEKRRREMGEAVDDIFRVYDIRMLEREAIDGHDTIAFSLTPKPDAQPKTRDGRMMRQFRGQAWISEVDHELVRLKVEAIENVSIGFGLLARIHKGARLSFERRKINGEVWLPAAFSYAGSARVGLLMTLRRRSTSEYSNYRKFTVDTSTTINAPSQ